jgi:hypothetical protein
MLMLFTLSGKGSIITIDCTHRVGEVMSISVHTFSDDLSADSLQRGVHETPVATDPASARNEASGVRLSS